MKKLLSVILSLALILGLVPTMVSAADKASGTIEYVFGLEAVDTETNPGLLVNDRLLTSTMANMSVDDIDESVSAPWRPASHNYTTGSEVKNGSIYWKTNRNPSTMLVCYAIELEVEQGGLYIPSITFTKQSNSPIVDVYLVKEETTSNNTSTAKFNFPDAATNLSRDGDIYTFVGGTDNTKRPNEYKLGQLDLYSGTKTPSSQEFAASEFDGNSKYYLIFHSVAGNPSCTASNSLYEIFISSFTLTPVEKVSVGVYAENGGTVSLGGTDTVTSVNIGSSQTATATPDEGYKFAYWKDASGDFVSSSASYPFNAYSNTYLIAVFDNVSDDADEIAVEFYDGDRDYLGKETLKESTAFTDITKPANYRMTGFEFTGWSIEDNTVIDSLVRATALYEEEGKVINNATVTVKDETTETYENVKYDQKIEASASGEGFSYWTRDDEIISYDEHYEYHVWDSAEIEAIYNAEVTDKAPCIVIEAANENIAEAAYMIEYDAAGYEIVEAGVLFGTDTNKEASSCYSKAKVNVSGKTHGQFTASKNVNGTADMQTIVRGYIIYKDENGNYKTKYADLA